MPLVSPDRILRGDHYKSWGAKLCGGAYYHHPLVLGTPFVKDYGWRPACYTAVPQTIKHRAVVCLSEQSLLGGHSLCPLVRHAREKSPRKELSQEYMRSRPPKCRKVEENWDPVSLSNGGKVTPSLLPS